MAEITQDQRLLKVYTPLAFNVLLIESFSGSEGISRPFYFKLKLRAEVATGKPRQVIPDQLVGEPMCIEVELRDQKKRYLNGLCRSFTKEGQDSTFAYYHAEIVPWFSFLELTSDCRIFQDQSVPDIIEKVVGELGYSKYFRNDLTRDYTKWDYCVQYRETDFNFLSRLMEEEGICYYFEHEQDKHTLVLADVNDCFDDCPQESDFLFDPEKGVGEFQDTVNGWEIRQELLSAKWVLRDHHLEKPGSYFDTEESSSFAGSSNAPLEMFDYPGEYAKKFNKPEKRVGDVRPEGEKLIRSRTVREERNHIIYQGTSHCRAFVSGYTFNIEGKNYVENDSYLLTEIQHTAIQHPAYLATEQVTGAHYSNAFSCIKSDVPYSPARITAKPVIHGVQTATVIDEHPQPQEEIWPDKFGRVLVRFPWDRLAQYACWIRVAQPWAGSRWGFQFIPRVGDEVVITFLEGDPDRPLIVGSVYNGTNLPPFALPDNKTQSGILTNSSMHGSTANANMLRFEDKKGQEQILVHAEKNLQTEVEHDETRTVGNNRTTTIHVNDTETVETGDYKQTVSQGNHSVEVSQGDHSLSVDMGDRKATISMGNDTLTVSLGDVTHEAPVGTYKVTAMNVNVTGTAGITLTCGASSIQMTPASISITAPMVMINC